MTYIENSIKQIRTNQINEFMSNFNLSEIDVDTIEDGLATLLGERPGVDFEYNVDVQINEGSKKEERIKKLEKIHVYFSYINEDNNICVGKVSYLVD